MKSIITGITSLIAVVLLFAAAGYAQFTRQAVLKADVPFEFNVGKKVLPAGEYVVVRVTPHILVLRDRDNHAVASFVAGAAVSTTVRSTPVLRFESVGTRHLLTQIWPSGVTTGYELIAPKRAVFLAQKPANTDVQAAASTPPGK